MTDTSELPRYAPQRSFPPYAFLPGRDPHPTRDPRGHSYGEALEDAVFHPPETWADNEEYLYGVDLYNHGYLWEAHEAWEGLWHPAKTDELVGPFLQGLIQCTAACLKIPMEQPKGLARLGQMGTERLERVGLAAGPIFMGLDVLDFVESMRTFVESAAPDVEERPRLRLLTD